MIFHLVENTEKQEEQKRTTTCHL